MNELNSSPSFKKQEEIALLIANEIYSAILIGYSPQLAAIKVDPTNIISQQERQIIEKNCRDILEIEDIL